MSFLNVKGMAILIKIIKTMVKKKCVGGCKSKDLKIIKTIVVGDILEGAKNGKLLEGSFTIVRECKVCGRRY